tara:strand:- start:2041 stop:3531 length:1491 start_codon:yes stop_codon:yes gene_type:complete
MAFIQAPSYIPPKLNDTWGGLADIFSDIASNREFKRQIERQRIADAQSAAAHASAQRNRDQLHTIRANKEAYDEAERARIQGNLLSNEDLVRNLMISQGKAHYGPGLNKPFGEGGGVYPVKDDPSLAEQTAAAARVSRGVTATTSQNLKRYYETVINIEKNKRAALKDGQDLRTATANADDAVRKAAYNLRVEPYLALKVKAQANEAVSKAESANINVDYYQDRRDKGALDLEGDQTTASALNRQRRLEDVASGVHKFPLETLATEESDAGPNYRKPTSVEQDYARQELIRKGYADQYKPLQREALGLADAAIGKRNWDKSLNKSGYTRAKTDTLADTFAPQFETQFNDSDEVSKREAEQMSRYALAAAKQIFNNPNIPLPRGTTALDLYNQILNQRELYSIDNGFRAFGIGNTNYEPITEVATIIENWQKLNSAERPQGNQEQATNNVTFTGINKQTGEQVTVTQEELIAAARERYPHMSVEVAIAKVKQDLGIQ